MKNLTVRRFPRCLIFVGRSEEIFRSISFLCLYLYLYLTETALFGTVKKEHIDICFIVFLLSLKIELKEKIVEIILLGGTL